MEEERNLAEIIGEIKAMTDEFVADMEEKITEIKNLKN